MLKQNLPFQNLTLLVGKVGYEQPEHLNWLHLGNPIRAYQIVLVKQFRLWLYEYQSMTLRADRNSCLALRRNIDQCRDPYQRGPQFIVCEVVVRYFHVLFL